MLKEIRKMMLKNKYLKNLEPLIYRPLIREMRSAYLMNKEKAAFTGYYRANKERFDELAQMLADDLSRETLDTVVRYRCAPRVGMLPKIVVRPQYFMSDIFQPAKDEVFIDGGGLHGRNGTRLFCVGRREYGKKSVHVGAG